MQRVTNSNRKIAKAKATCDGSLCGVRFNIFSGEGDYRVISTDYDNYAVVYSCTDLIFGYTFVGLWVLARSNSLSS
jgi:hypothetical protein